MIYIRTGPRFLFIRTEHVDELKDFFSNHLNGRICSFKHALENSYEHNTLLFITLPGHVKTRVEDAKSILLIPHDSPIVLTSLFNNNLVDKVSDVNLAPGSIVLRVVGDGSPVIQKLKNEYSATLLGWRDAIEQGEADDTIISLSNKPINKALHYNDIIRPNLLINMPVYSLYRELRHQGLRFITENLDNKQWYEVRINIYDAAGFYKEHYERIIHVLSALDAGMILGESWTRDHALTLFSVMAYQIRLFTLLKPEEIKRILMALECSSNGERFVDFDLYYRNRKISKNDKKVKVLNKKPRMEYRKELFDKLSDKTVNKLLKIEDYIAKNS
ncbi:MAG: hypothetical protein PHP06_05385 [Clostridia bacterium]|nr:hypothetical protein [Clostridia bacterium]